MNAELTQGKGVSGAYSLPSVGQQRLHVIHFLALMVFD